MAGHFEHILKQPVHQAGDVVDLVFADLHQPQPALAARALHRIDEAVGIVDMVVRVGTGVRAGHG